MGGPRDQDVGFPLKGMKSSRTNVEGSWEEIDRIGEFGSVNLRIDEIFLPETLRQGLGSAFFPLLRKRLDFFISPSVLSCRG